VITANDGGVDWSVNGGESWYAPMLPITQFYHVNVDSRTPYHVHGNMQDLGTASGPSNSLSTRGITRFDWRSVGGGETGHTASVPGDPDIVYAGEYFGYISRYDNRTRQARNVSIYPMDTSGQGAAEARYRFQWTAPLLVSRHDPDVVYHGSQYLMRSKDGGMHWEVASPDLTRDDETKQQFAGGPIVGDNTGVEIYDTIFAIAESPTKAGVLWVGSDDGLVHVSLDDGAEWRNVTPPGLPEWSTVATIEASSHHEGTAYVVADAHRLDDMKPYLFKTTDYGSSWESLTSGMDPDVYLHTIREDPDVPGLLYAGTERGVLFSRDDGKTWTPLELNLPPVAVHELRVKDGDLVVGTHGRSIWIFDDLTPVREMSPDVEAETAHLFSARPAIRWRYHGGPRDIYAGENPPQGAMLHYYLKEEPEEDIRLRILKPDGTEVRAYSSEEQEAPEPEGTPDAFFEKLKALPKKAGVNRFVWDFRWNGAEIIPGAEIDMGDPRQGPMALPGDYVVELTVGEQVLTTPLVLEMDPRVTIARSDLEEQLRFSLSIRDSITSLTETVGEIRSVRGQLEAMRDRLAGRESAESLVASAGDLVATCDDLERRLHNPEAKVAYDILATPGGAKLYSKLGPLMDYVNEGDGAPTQGMREVYDELRGELETVQAEWGSFKSGELAAWNDSASTLPHVVVGATPP
jgi:hypothetical protein